MAMSDKDDTWEMTIANAMMNHAATEINDSRFKIGSYMLSSSATMHHGVGVAVRGF